MSFMAAAAAVVGGNGVMQAGNRYGMQRKTQGAAVQGRQC